MFLLRLSVSIQVDKKIFRIINKWGIQINIGGRGNSKIKKQRGCLLGTQVKYSNLIYVFESTNRFIYEHIHIDLLF